MRQFILFLLLTVSSVMFAQNEYELKRNEETKRVFYQGVINHAEMKQEDLFAKGISWFSEKKKKLISQNEEINQLVGEATFSTIGRKSAYSKAYHYNFTCEITLEFKDGKTRYTMDHFKKKTSPGEPGSTLEYFIENYKPQISSRKSRDREAKMLDEIEIEVDSQIQDLIVQLTSHFGPEKKSDW